MFEGMKGVAKGQKVAKIVSSSTMETINHLVLNDGDIKTNDTLFICSRYFFYAKLLVIPTNMSESKFIKYTGAIDMQAKDLLNEWLQKTTGVFSLNDYFDSFDMEFKNFTTSINDNYDIPEDAGSQKFDIIKSYAAEQVLTDILTQFDSENNDLKIKIGECCEAIRQELV